MKTAIGFLLVLAIAGGGAAYYVTQVSGDSPPSFRTVPITRGDLVSTISATGTAEPEEVVDVGAQVVGRIKSLGLDPSDPQKKTIDYGSVVQENTILALIDDAVYKAQVDQAQASLLRAKADLLQMQAKVEQTKQERSRVESLRATKAIADTEYDLAVANHKVALANLAVGDAAIKQSEATLEMARTNLDYTIIKSPVRGVIIDRRVNVGQTVVASLNAPSLFLIAKDLRRMQVWASVNEADIGRIKPGLPVRFTVDAYPGDTFRGKVGQIRLNATMTQNVVTYTVVVETDNSDLKILPYLTANVQFEIDQHKGVLLVPNAALRWKPRPQLIAPEPAPEATSAAGAVRGSPDPAQGSTEGLQKRQGRPSVQDPAGSGDPRRAHAKHPGQTTAGKPAKERTDRGRLWVQDGDFVRPIDVRVGAGDGTQTEVSGDNLSEGMEIVVGEVRKEERGQGDTNNPFMPKLFRGGQKKSQ